MIRLIKKGALIAIVCLMPVSSFAQNSIEWPVSGKITTRSAKEITSSNLWTGGETLDRDYADYEQYKKYLGPLGAKKIRLQSGWSKTEKTKGVYDFAWLDAIVNDALSQGVQPWIQTSYGNLLYEGAGSVDLGGGIPDGKEGLEAWEKYVSALVSHFKDRVHEWEIWNEPDLGENRKTPELYAELFCRTGRIIRELHPQATIVALAIAGLNVEYVTAFFEYLKIRNALSYVDVISFHGYPMIPETTFESLEKVRQLAWGYRPEIEFWQGETGCPSTKGSSGALGNHDWTELTQAKWDLRRALSHIGRGIPYSQFLLCEFSYLNHPGYANRNKLNTKGLLKINEKTQAVEHVKQAYHAYRNLCAIFDGNMKPEKEFEYSASDMKRLSLQAFKHEKKNIHAIAVWFGDQIPSDENEYRMTTLTFEKLDVKKAVYVDVRNGNVYRIPEENIKKEQGKISVTVPIYDSPCVITDALLTDREPFSETEINLEKLCKIKTRKASDIRFSQLGIGCEVLDRDFASYNAYKDFLGNLGVKHARFQSGWAKTEKQKGIYDFKWLDAVLDDCLSKAIQPWVCICYGNTIYPGAGNEQSSSTLPISGEALQAWLKYVEKLVTQYKNKVFEWEVWNESDHRVSRGATAEDYAMFFLETSKVIRSVQPDAKVIVGGMCSSGITDYIRTVFNYLKTKDALDMVDGLTFHGYPNNPDKTFKENLELVAFVKQYGNIEAWMGETGAPSTKGTSGALSNTEFTELSQAKWDLRRALGFLGNGIKFSLFTLSEFNYPGNKLNTKGLLKINEDLSIAYVKQSYYGYQNLCSLFDADIVASGRKDHLVQTSDTVSLYSFLDMQTHTPVLAYWNSSGKPGEALNTSTVTIDVSSCSFKEPVLIDIRTGIIYDIPESAFRGGKMALPVYDSPLLIVERKILTEKYLL
jgi:beta-glucosidase/6-phospho-beta-glucosidase/beta-galactosidase